MSLREQIKEIVTRYINAEFSERIAFPIQVTTLCAKFFGEYVQESADTRAVRRAYQLLSRNTEPWVSDDEPAVD